MNLNKSASITGDMAKRIMYLAILANSNKSEFYGTDGIVNQNALDEAAKGVKDILKYGIEAIYSEFLEIESNAVRNPAIDLYKTNKEKFIEYCVQNFNNADFPEDYGGIPWTNVAKSLLNLYRLKSNLELQNDYLKQNKIKKLIVLELNHFDSLVHNNGSILDKIIRSESNETKSSHRIVERVYQLEKLLNLKDAKNTDHVFNESFKILEKEDYTFPFNEEKHKFIKPFEETISNFDKNLEDENIAYISRKIPTLIKFIDDFKEITDNRIERLEKEIIRNKKDPDFYYVTSDLINFIGKFYIFPAKKSEKIKKIEKIIEEQINSKIIRLLDEIKKEKEIFNDENFNNTLTDEFIKKSINKVLNIFKNVSKNIEYIKSLYLSI